MIRIGQGFDVHRYADGNGFVLGGVQVDCSYQVIAHSDGDVLLHACCDALLGAMGQGDIGQHFPDSDPVYRNCDSRELLRAVYAMLEGQAQSVINLDATIIAQSPRLSSYVPQMRQNIASDLGITASEVNIKSTTTEHLGFVGREEGIAAMAVVLISDRNL